MGIKEQLMKLKENWLMIVLVLVLFVAVSGGPSLMQGISSNSYGAARDMMSLSESAQGYAAKSSYMPPIEQPGFAPGVQDRKITKTASASTEVKKGTFKDAESKLKNILKSSDAYLLSENVNKYGESWRSYYQGSYQIKIDTKKYDAVVSQLKEIGEITYFNENSEDITASYTNLKTEIQSEKDRLKRFQSMYEQSTIIADKITLTDRMFDLERNIKYLEEALNNANLRVDYSTIYFTITEKQSEYSSIVFVKFSELVNSLVSSFNSLIKLVVVLLPWALGFLIVRSVWKYARKKR